MRKTFVFAAISLSLMTAGCSKKNQTAELVLDQQPVAIGIPNHPVINSPQRVLLNATAFRMSGDYADNVAVTLNADGTFAYFPDPSDITEASRPLDLGNGWWLNRQGISSRSCFTRYTFEEYAALKEVPSREQLKEAIIPGARVTEFKTLPFPAAEAIEKLDSIRAILK